MNHSKEVRKTDQSNPIDEYFQCLSYCDIHPKGIDNDCEVICMERHLKANYWEFEGFLFSCLNFFKRN